MKKRALAVVLAVLMAVGMLTGCRSYGDPEDDERYWGGKESSIVTEESGESYASSATDEGSSSVDTQESSQIASEATQETSPKVPFVPSAPAEGPSEEWDNCMSIALFGIDNQDLRALIKGGRSKSILIVNVNLDTDEVRLVSIDRNTYLNYGEDKYTKCQSAYANGGIEQAVRMLNANLDTAINDCIAINYAGLSEFVDFLGGIQLDVSLDEKEQQKLQSQQAGIMNILGCDELSIPDNGEQLLSGDQVAAYCYIEGMGNNTRQLQVVKAIDEKIKQTDRSVLKQAYEACLDNMAPTLSSDELESLLDDAAKYQIVGADSFPFEDMSEAVIVGSNGQCNVPMDLEANVIRLHQFLYNVQDYAVSGTVKEYSEQIDENVSPYLR